MAYKLSELMDKLKEGGLELSEDAAQHVSKSVFGWLRESAEESKNPYDDILIAVYNAAEAKIDPILDKIDGKSN